MNVNDWDEDNVQSLVGTHAVFLEDLTEVYLGDLSESAAAAILGLINAPNLVIMELEDIENVTFTADPGPHEDFCSTQE